MKKSALGPKLLLLCLSIGILAFAGCQDTLEPKRNDIFGQLTKTTIAGIVLDEAGKPLPNATLTVIGASGSAVSDSNGLFIFRDLNVPGQRCVVKSEKKGYFNATRAVIPVTGGHVSVKLVASPEKLAGTVNAVSGGSVTVTNGVQVALPAGGITTAKGETYTGQVNVFSRYLDPTKTTFGALTPGGDMAALDASGAQVQLYSMGVMDVKLESPSGDALQVGNGKQATLTYPIPASRNAQAQTTVPLWYFDETKGFWVEEGAATKANGNYVGTVAHFSSWNCDYRGERAYVKGRVLDCEGNPVSGATINIDGPTATSDSLGNFMRWIPAEWELNVKVYAAGDLFPSPGVKIPKTPAGQTYDLGDITCPCPAYVTGTVKDCNDLTDAFVLVSWQDGAGRSSVSGTTKSGVFKLPAPANTDVVVIVMGFNGFSASTTGRSGAVKSIADVGIVKVCEGGSGVTSRNSITLSGGPFAATGETYDLKGLTASTSQYYDSTTKQTETLVYINNKQNDSAYFSLSFTAKLGVQDWSASANSTRYGSLTVMVHKNGLTYYMFGKSGSTKVTQLAVNPGEIFDGTFVGICKSESITPPTDIAVSGNFSVIKQ